MSSHITPVNESLTIDTTSRDVDRDSFIAYQDSLSERAEEKREPASTPNPR